MPRFIPSLTAYVIPSINNVFRGRCALYSKRSVAARSRRFQHRNSDAKGIVMLRLPNCSMLSIDSGDFADAHCATPLCRSLTPAIPASKLTLPPSKSKSFV